MGGALGGSTKNIRQKNVPWTEEIFGGL